MENATRQLLPASPKSLYRAGSVSAFLIVVSYFILTALYIFIGALQGESEEWLKHLATYNAEWRIILWLSVLTDLLLIPVAFALYVLLQKMNKSVMIFSTALLLLFVILDLAVTWPNYTSLITLSNMYAYAVNNVHRATFITAATYPFTVLSSTLFAVYAILLPSIGILLTGFVMLSANFNKFAGYIGIVTGISGIVSVIGPVFVEALGIVAILTSVFTIIWLALVGYILFKFSSS